MAILKKSGSSEFQINSSSNSNQLNVTLSVRIHRNFLIKIISKNCKASGFWGYKAVR